jgi:NAD(P)-dependent dehydrogenase (short-subunit alcohol dehydrogenase family)
MNMMATTIAPFAGKVALVTGAAAGFGDAIARRLAAGGARLILLDRDAERGQSLTAQLQQEGKQALFIEVDVADPDRLRAALEEGIAHYGALDLAVNNAGVSGGPMAPIWEMPFAQWRNTHAVNLDSVFTCLQVEMAAMLGRGGAIVNMASILGQVAMGGVAHYVSSKHGLVGLTRTAALDGGPQGIRVNAVAPTFVPTALTAAVPPEVWTDLRARHALAHLPTPAEVAALTCFLLSDDAASITGSVHLADAGWCAQ